MLKKLRDLATRKYFRMAFIVSTLVFAAASPAQLPPNDRVAAATDEIVGNFRRMIVLEELKAQLPAPEQRATPSPKGQALVENALRDEWNDGGLPPKTLLLTFDDGPHARYTAEILRILDHYKVKAIFFQVGRNLGVMRDGRAEVTRNVNVVEALLRGGHVIANHTYTHPVLPKLTDAQVDDEIDTTQALLLAIAPQSGRAPLFRPPYGARNPLVLVEIADRGLRSVIWNIDSRDWAAPILQSDGNGLVVE